MVLLRLIVKVLPREAPGQPSSGSGKIPSFLLIAREPEKLTLAGLVWMITEKWSRMRPMDPPLEIKTLLDEAHPTDELDPDLSTADVFVDAGRAQKEGNDQRATVLVVQKPAERPVRYESVVQDWHGAAKAYAPKMQMQGGLGQRQMQCQLGAGASRPPVPLFNVGPGVRGGQQVCQQQRQQQQRQQGQRQQTQQPRKISGSQKRQQLPSQAQARSQPQLRLQAKLQAQQLRQANETPFLEQETPVRKSTTVSGARKNKLSPPKWGSSPILPGSATQSSPLLSRNGIQHSQSNGSNLGSSQIEQSPSYLPDPNQPLPSREGRPRIIIQDSQKIDDSTLGQFKPTDSFKDSVLEQIPQQKSVPFSPLRLGQAAQKNPSVSKNCQKDDPFGLGSGSKVQKYGRGASSALRRPSAPRPKPIMHIEDDESSIRKKHRTDVFDFNSGDSDVHRITSRRQRFDAMDDSGSVPESNPEINTAQATEESRILPNQSNKIALSRPQVASSQDNPAVIPNSDAEMPDIPETSSSSRLQSAMAGKRRKPSFDSRSSASNDDIAVGETPQRKRQKPLSQVSSFGRDDVEDHLSQKRKRSSTSRTSPPTNEQPMASQDTSNRKAGNPSSPDVARTQASFEFLPKEQELGATEREALQSTHLLSSPKEYGQPPIKLQQVPTSPQLLKGTEQSQLDPVSCKNIEPERTSPPSRVPSIELGTPPPNQIAESLVATNRKFSGPSESKSESESQSGSDSETDLENYGEDEGKRVWKLWKPSGSPQPIALSNTTTTTTKKQEQMTEPEDLSSKSKLQTEPQLKQPALQSDSQSDYNKESERKQLVEARKAPQFSEPDVTTRSSEEQEKQPQPKPPVEQKQQLLSKPEQVPKAPQCSSRSSDSESVSESESSSGSASQSSDSYSDSNEEGQQVVEAWKAPQPPQLAVATSSDKNKGQQSQRKCPPEQQQSLPKPKPEPKPRPQDSKPSDSGSGSEPESESGSESTSGSESGSESELDSHKEKQRVVGVSKTPQHTQSAVPKNSNREKQEQGLRPQSNCRRIDKPVSDPTRPAPGSSDNDNDSDDSSSSSEDDTDSESADSSNSLHFPRKLTSNQSEQGSSDARHNNKLPSRQPTSTFTTKSQAQPRSLPPRQPASSPIAPSSIVPHLPAPSSLSKGQWLSASQPTSMPSSSGGGSEGGNNISLSLLKKRQQSQESEKSGNGGLGLGSSLFGLGSGLWNKLGKGGK